MRHRVKQIGCVVLFSLQWLVLSAQSDIAGLSCENPLVLTDSFSIYIPGGGSYWFTAWTYDLPLHTRYIMEGNHQEEEPVAYVDFTCTFGVYEDPNLATLINDATGWGVPVPMKFVFEREYRDGKTYFDVEVSASYREMMMNYGITYNVQAYVNVQIPRS